METSPKTVFETYIREVTTLVHLTVNGEEIVTTVDHPFYVKNQGFIKAGELIVGDKFLNVNGNVLLVENFAIELTEKPVTVYNFQVEDYHTYFVGECGVWVHNSNCKLIKNDDGTYDAELSYKEDWTPGQRAEADAIDFAIALNVQHGSNYENTELHFGFSREEGNLFNGENPPTVEEFKRRANELGSEVMKDFVHEALQYVEFNDNLDIVDFANGSTDDKEIINKLYNLKALDVSYCNITDISFVLNLPKLEEFSYLGHDTHGIDLKCLNEHPNYDEAWMKD